MNLLNPKNGFIIEVSNISFFWSFLFGPFYFIQHSMFLVALVVSVIESCLITIWVFSVGASTVVRMNKETIATDGAYYILLYIALRLTVCCFTNQMIRNHFLGDKNWRLE